MKVARVMIKCENVTFVYEGDEGENKKVLDNVSLEIKKGSFVAVLGRNGSGKSTLAKHFNAVLEPSAGRVLVNGIDTKCGERLFDIRKSVGMVFQNPDNQIVATTVEEDVAFGLENLAVPREEMIKRVDEALASVGMTGFKKAQPHLLSGGQKQRVAIAGVLAMEPECIVLDEPTAMLDPMGRKEVLDTICRLKEENGMSVALITHYMEEAAMADRVIVIDDGVVIMDGKPKEVFSQVEKLKSVGLDVPQVTELMWELKKCGLPISHEMITINDAADELMKLLGASK